MTGLCYAEFASLVPISGSAYTYAYATLGEIVAWIIGWDLILEYAVGNIAVAVSWSGYFCEFLRGFGIEFPRWLATDLRTALAHARRFSTRRRTCWGVPVVFNLPAVFIVTAITVLLVIGIRESAWFNAVMVAIKLVVLAFFVVVGACYVEPENWHPFAPERLGGHSGRGGRGVLRLHRLRRRLDHRRGMPQSAARPADRHPRLAGRSAP